MRSILTIIVMAAIAVSAASASGSVVWDFTYEYDNVFSANADDYVHSVTNAGKVNESGTYYYQPLSGNTDPGVILYKFSFSEITEGAHLQAGISTFNWTPNSGEGWLYASNNGSDWTELTYVGPPAPSTAHYGGYNSFLLPSVLGTKELWVKAELDTSVSYSRNTSQFSRGYANDSPSFKVEVDLAPEPGTMMLLAAGGLAILKRRRRIRC